MHGFDSSVTLILALDAEEAAGNASFEFTSDNDTDDEVTDHSERVQASPILPLSSCWNMQSRCVRRASGHTRQKPQCHAGRNTLRHIPRVLLAILDASLFLCQAFPSAAFNRVIFLSPRIPISTINHQLRSTRSSQFIHHGQVNALEGQAPVPCKEADRGRVRRRRSSTAQPSAPKTQGPHDEGQERRRGGFRRGCGLVQRRGCGATRWHIYGEVRGRWRRRHGD